MLIPVGRYGLAPAGVPASMQERLRRRAGSDGLCLFAADQAHGRPAGGAFGCYSTQQLLHGRAIAGLGRRVYGLVPDGVDKIKITLADNTTSTVNVQQNFFIYSGSLGRGEIRWLNKHGAVLRTIAHAADLG